MLPLNRVAEFHVVFSGYLLVIHFKYSRVYMSIPNSLTIPFPHSPPPPTPNNNHKLVLEVCESLSVFWVHLYHFFLESTYKGCHMIFLLLCLTYCTQYGTLQVYPILPQMAFFILFNHREIFHCIYVPRLLYPFLCWWTFRLLPCLSYCKQCCNEHWGACIHLDHVFLQIHAQEWDCRVIW